MAISYLFWKSYVNRVINMWPFVSLFHLTYCFWSYSMLLQATLYVSVFLFYSEVIFYCIVHTILYALIYWWTFEFFFLFGYCAYCCCEQSCTRICLSTCFYVFFWIYSRSAIAGSYGNTMCSLVEDSPNFSSDWTIYIPLAMYKGSSFSTLLSPTQFFSIFLKK